MISKDRDPLSSKLRISDLADVQRIPTLLSGILSTLLKPYIGE